MWRSWNTSLNSLAHFFAASKAKVVFFCIIVYLQIYWVLGALVCQAIVSKANLLLLQKNTERQCSIHIQILQLPLLTLSTGAALGIMSGKGSVHYLLRASEIWWVESHLTLWWAFLKTIEVWCLQEVPETTCVNIQKLHAEKNWALPGWKLRASQTHREYHYPGRR